MEQVLATFGIDWRLLLINAANFGLLLFVLWYFLYGPLMRVLEERRTRIAQGVADADAAAQMRKEVASSRDGILAAAGRDADTILASARASALKKEKELVAEGEAAAGRVLEDASREAEELKRQSLEESKQEIAKLVVLGIEKVAAKKS